MPIELEQIKVWFVYCGLFGKDVDSSFTHFGVAYDYLTKFV